MTVFGVDNGRRSALNLWRQTAEVEIPPLTWSELNGKRERISGLSFTW